MSEKSNPNKGELTLSGNRSLAIKESSLVQRGLKLIDEINKQSWDYTKEQIDSIANEAMSLLIKEGVPNNEGIFNIIKDLEFHYQMEHGQFFSSIEDFKGIQFDVKFMCGQFRFSYDFGNRIFHYWARTFHKADNKILFDKDANAEGIPLTSEEIVYELKKLIEEHDDEVLSSNYLELTHIKGGFTLRKIPKARKVPRYINLWMAYEVGKGNPFKKYTSQDFDVGRAPFDIQVSGSKVLLNKENIIQIEVQRGNFKLTVTGFDPQRILKIRTNP